MREAKLGKREFGGYWVTDRNTGDLLGWVIPQGREWISYEAGRQASDNGRRIGVAFSTRREATDEVLIESVCRY